MTNLSVQLARGDAEELGDAERLLRRGMQIRREVYGEEHPEVAHSLHLLANLYATEGSNPEVADPRRACTNTLEPCLGQDLLPEARPSRG